MVSFVLLAINALVTFPLMIWIEEHELEQRFGASYSQYREKVPLIPNVFAWLDRKRTA